jgi:hypothetical protein
MRPQNNHYYQVLIGYNGEDYRAKYYPSGTIMNVRALEVKSADPSFFLFWNIKGAISFQEKHVTILKEITRDEYIKG